MSHLTWQPVFRSRDGTPSPWRSVTRLAVATGTVLAIIGSILPWATGFAPPYGLTTISGFEGAGDGLILIALAGATAGLVMSRSASESSTRIVQIAPFVLSVLAGGIWLLAEIQTRTIVEGWIAGGGTGQLMPGIWVAGVGVLVMLQLTALLAARRWLETPALHLQPFGEVPEGRGHGLLLGVGVLLGAVGGFAGAIALAEQFLSAKTSLFIVVLAAIGSILGANVGAALARRIWRIGRRVGR